MYAMRVHIRDQDWNKRTCLSQIAKEGWIMWQTIVTETTEPHECIVIKYFLTP